MILKIKTADIELEYRDEYSIIEEAAKKRLLEIINQIYVNQENSKSLPHISAKEAFGGIK
jgi:hypothetical protein